MVDKLSFLINDFPAILKGLDPDTQPKWGKMTVQQMIEHMADSVRIANGKDKFEVITPEERLGAMKEFLLSEKEFRPDTKNAMLAEEPVPVRLASITDAVEELETELRDFELYFLTYPGATTVNPSFGALNFNEWTQLLHKHAVHHLKQFGYESSGL